VSETLFREVEASVIQRNADLQADASPFELLTVTAFEIFNRERVAVGIVEAGMGGRDDATNIVGRKAVTVLANIALDHQEFLGATADAIARNKCGILRRGVPLVYDGTNAPDVLAAIADEAARAGAGPLHACSRMPLGGRRSRAFARFGRALANRRAHRVNIAVAWKAALVLLEKLGVDADPLKPALFEAVRTARWPGRYQHVDLVNVVGAARKAFVDGAHNEKAAESLGFFVEREFRGVDDGDSGKKRRFYVLPVTWVLAASSTKDVRTILRHLLKPGDRVIAVEFGPVDGMAFVKPMESEKLIEFANEAIKEQNGELKEAKSFGKNIEDALKYATNVASNDAIVIAGSLYLVSDVFRLLRDANAREGAAPVADLWTGRTTEDDKVGQKKKILPSGRGPGRPKGSQNKTVKT